MEQQLARSDYLVGDCYSIADAALYAHTLIADEGGFELARYWAMSRGLARVAGQPNHVKTDAGEP